MTNAILWEFLPPNNSEDKEFTIAYIRQVHHFQGFQDIFIPKNVFSSLSSIIEPNDKFVKKLPLIGKTDKRILEDFEKSINTLLWSIKKTDIFETGLTSFLVAFAIWVQAKKLKSAIILHLSNPTSNFSRLMHILAGEQRKFVECVADDVESWFFSHFADFPAEWPYFFNFTSSTIDMLEKDPIFLEYQRNFIDSREKFFEVGFEKTNLTEYDKILSRITANQKVLFNHVSKNYREHFIATKASLAPSKENWKALRHLTWKCNSFGKMLEHAEIYGSNFIPYFVRFDFYPFELLKKIKANSLLSERDTAFNSTYSFETALKAEMDFVLNNFRKRIGGI